MKRLMLALVLLMVTSAVMASDSIRFGSRVITLGDTEGMVLKVAGKPDSREPIENQYGALVGYRLEYDLENKTVLITIKQGRVTDIQEVYN